MVPQAPSKKYSREKLLLKSRFRVNNLRKNNNSHVYNEKVEGIYLGIFNSIQQTGVEVQVE